MKRYYIRPCLPLDHVTCGRASDMTLMQFDTEEQRARFINLSNEIALAAKCQNQNIADCSIAIAHDCAGKSFRMLGKAQSKRSR